MRHILVDVMRALADQGYHTTLPDLPGTGESLTPLHKTTFSDWRGALAAAAEMVGRPLLIASCRTGCLIDDAAQARHVWRCAPETGARLVRDLMRTRLTGASPDTDGGMVTLAGHVLQQSLIDELAQKSPVPLPSLRTARLTTDAADADVRLLGSPVWRRSEPGDDPALQSSMTQDLLAWAAQCASS